MIDYKNELNSAQYEAVTTLTGSVLVIAGAGSGKTRTIVYRLANMIESGIPASSILLLTFTRKAAQEMLDRARILLRKEHERPESQLPPMDLSSVQGGTFHSFAFSVLRLFPPEEFGGKITVMDSHDMLSSLQHCREVLKAGKGDRSFPKNQTILGIISKSRNKEISIEDVLRKEFSHLLGHTDTLESLYKAYSEFKREKGLVDYDDLLFLLEESLFNRPDVLNYCRRRYLYIMVDEYQDTNPVQARIVALISGAGKKSDDLVEQGEGNIMVVGDDAQSIYAFRGADVKNILRFPETFPQTKIIQLEENYRSSQPILDFTNALLANATEGYTKHLFTSRKGGTKPNVIRPFSGTAQATLATAKIIELLNIYPANEIAVLFRAGFHSYGLEGELNKIGLKFCKYGGLRYAEAAHIKDVVSYIRLVFNPLDYTAFTRIAQFSKGIGPKTCLKLYQLTLSGNTVALSKNLDKYPDFGEDLTFIDMLRASEASPAIMLEKTVDHFKNRLALRYPDDYPRRLQGLEELVIMARADTDLDVFLAGLSMDDPSHEEEERSAITLSTIHSAKGLEWSAVVLLDLVEDRFPSRHSLLRAEEFEEERRLMYVACTRAKKHLDLFVPATISVGGAGGSIPAVPSPFIREIPFALYNEWQEGYRGGLVKKTIESPKKNVSTILAATINSSALVEESANNIVVSASNITIVPPEQCGFCHHKIFGRGKIVQHLPPDKYRVNFPGIGLKVIMAAFLTLE